MRVIVHKNLLRFPVSVAVAQPFVFLLEPSHEIDSDVQGCVTPARRSPVVVPEELEVRSGSVADGPDFGFGHNTSVFVFVKQDQDRVFGVDGRPSVPDFEPWLPIPVCEGLVADALETREMF